MAFVANVMFFGVYFQVSFNILIRIKHATYFSKIVLVLFYYIKIIHGVYKVHFVYYNFYGKIYFNVLEKKQNIFFKKIGVITFKTNLNK